MPSLLTSAQRKRVAETFGTTRGDVPDVRLDDDWRVIRGVVFRLARGDSQHLTVALDPRSVRPVPNAHVGDRTSPRGTHSTSRRPAWRRSPRARFSRHALSDRGSTPLRRAHSARARPLASTAARQALASPASRTFRSTMTTSGAKITPEHLSITRAPLMCHDVDRPRVDAPFPNPVHPVYAGLGDLGEGITRFSFVPDPPSRHPDLRPKDHRSSADAPPGLAGGSPNTCVRRREYRPGGATGWSWGSRVRPSRAIEARVVLQNPQVEKEVSASDPA
jgi:hypothetical protein